jgi:peptide/nickel transport system permease protein
MADTAGGEGPTLIRVVTGRLGRLRTLPYWTMAVVVLAVLYAFIVPAVASPTLIQVNPAHGFESPSLQHLFGTDHLGRDMFTITAMGLKTSLLISLSVVVCAGAFGWIIGATAGLVGGRVDEILSRVMDVFNAFPGLILIIGLLTALGSSFGNIVLVMSLASWVSFGRVIRARVMELRPEAFIVTSRLFGSSVPATLGRHVWPNTVGLMLSISMVQIPNQMLGEATVSFLGFGVQPPNQSLGLIINAEKDYLQVQPLPVIIAGAVLVITCACIAITGLQLRERR